MGVDKKIEVDSDHKSSKIGLESPEQRARGIALARQLNPTISEPSEGANTPVTEAEKKAASRQHKEGRLREEALERITEQETDPLPTESGIHITSQKVEKKQRKREGKAVRMAKKQAAAAVSAGQLTTAGEDILMVDANPTPSAGQDIFMVDVNPTQIGTEARKPSSDNEDDEGGGTPFAAQHLSGSMALPSGKNRATRRREMLIDRQRAKIQKKLGLPVGSNDKADEVQSRLEEWIKRTGQRAAEIQSKKKSRKAREAQRLRAKKRKLLTEHKLKENEKGGVREMKRVAGPG